MLYWTLLIIMLEFFYYSPLGITFSERYFMFTITSEQDLYYKGIAVFILFICVLIIIVGIILVHEFPYKIAKRRGHPQQDAIRCMAIMGLILIPLWFFAMIWAYMRGKTFGAPIKNANINLTEIIVDDDSILIDKEKLLKSIKQKTKPITKSKSTGNTTHSKKQKTAQRTNISEDTDSPPSTPATRQDNSTTNKNDSTSTNLN